MVLDSNTWNRLTVSKQMNSANLKIKLPTRVSLKNHLNYTYKKNFEINNQERLVCPRTPTNQTANEDYVS